MRRALGCLATVVCFTLLGCKDKGPAPEPPPAPTPADSARESPPEELLPPQLRPPEKPDPTERVEGPLDLCSREVPGLAVSFGEALPPPAAAKLLVRAARQTAAAKLEPRLDLLSPALVERYRGALAELDRQGTLTTGQAPLTIPGASAEQVEALDELLGLLIVPRTLWRVSGPRLVRDALPSGADGGMDARATEEAVARLCTGAVAREVFGDPAVEAMLSQEVIWVRMFVRRVLRGQAQGR